MSAGHFEEEITGRLYDVALVRRAWEYVRPYRLWLLVCGLLLTVVTGLELIGPYLLKQTIDVYIVRQDYAGVQRMGMAYLGVLLGIFVCQFCQLYLLSWVGQQVIYDLRTRLFTHLEGLALSFFNRNPVGRLMTRVINDVEVLNDLFTAGIINIVGDVIVLFGIAGIMLALNWKLAVLCFLTLPFVAYATYEFRKHAVPAYRRIRTLLSRLHGMLQESIAGMSTLQLFRRERMNAELFDEQNRAFRHQSTRTILYHALFTPAITVVTGLATAGILWVGGRGIVAGALTVGVVAAFLQYLHRFFNPIQDLAEKYNLVQSAMTSAERVFQLLDTEERIPEPAAPRSLGHGRGALSLRDVWLRYGRTAEGNGAEANGHDLSWVGELEHGRADGWALRGVSLEVAPGEHLAIVGATGAGKTSLVSALTRLYEINKGEILLDGIRVDEFSLEALRRHVGVVTQEPFIFSGTLADNIKLGNEDISMARIEEVCGQLGIGEWIRSLPHGYDEMLRERGNNLSTGQKQLVSFARMLAHDPRILILDEAASSMDPATEQLVHRALSKLLEGRTSLIIAHRLSTIRDCHRIIVMKDGQIAEAGTHRELLARQGLYAALHRLQSLKGS